MTAQPRDLGVDPNVAKNAVQHGFTRREAIARDTMLGDLQRESFGYFVHEVNEANGLVLDKTAEGWPEGCASYARRPPSSRTITVSYSTSPSLRTVRPTALPYTGSTSRGSALSARSSLRPESIARRISSSLAVRPCTTLLRTSQNSRRDSPTCRGMPPEAVSLAKASFAGSVRRPSSGSNDVNSWRSSPSSSEASSRRPAFGDCAAVVRIR